MRPTTPLALGRGSARVLYATKREDNVPFSPTCALFEEMMRVRESHVTVLNSRSSVVRFCTTPTRLIPSDFLAQKSSQCLPLLPSSKTRCRPSTIKTRASGSPSRRLETCEIADRNPRVQNLSVCTISLTPSPKASFPRLLTTFTRAPFLTARPRDLSPDLSDIDD
jgi:hypothetical protein